MPEHVLNGEGMILGRLGSTVAKLLLNGNEVKIVNAEHIAISGHMRDLVTKYKQRIELKDKANPEHSPYISRRPDMFVKRVIRGMLPWKQPKGKAAYRRLRVYVGVPKDIKVGNENKIKTKHAKEVYETTVTVGELMKKLGYG